MKRAPKGLRKYILIAIAITFVVVGMVTAPTPLPTGVPLLALGIVMLVTISATARLVVRRLRTRSGTVDRGFAFVETRANRPIATVLKRTRPLARKIEAKAAMKAATNAIQSVRNRRAGSHSPSSD